MGQDPVKLHYRFENMFVGDADEEMEANHVPSKV